MTPPEVREQDATALQTSDSSPRGGNDLPVRCGWTVVWLAVLTTGLNFWGSWSSWPGSALFAPLLVVVSLLGLAAVWAVRNPLSRTFQLLVLGFSLVAVGMPQAVSIHVRQFFTTDSAAFDQYATRLVVGGRNPYASSMKPAAYLLGSPSHFWTYTVDGSFVSHVSYPAGSFLLQAPIWALGFHHELTDWVDLAAWLVTGVLLFFMLPATLRWLALVIVLTGQFVWVFSNGGTDALFLPFLVVAVWRWDRFGRGRGAGWASWLGPISLGIACSIKQTPWFCVPFLVIGVAFEANGGGRDALRAAVRYLGVVIAVFTTVNLPFIVWSPRAWAHGVLLPFTGKLVADGQGAVSVALHGLTGGASLSALSVAGGLTLIALLVAYVLWYPTLKRVWLFLLPVVLFVPGRSLSGYLIDLFPAAVIAVSSISGPIGTTGTKIGIPSFHGRRRGMRWALTSVPVAAALAVAGWAFTAAPLQVTLVGFRTSHAAQELDSVQVRLHNSTDRPVVPHVMVVIGSRHPTGFWEPLTGGRRLVIDPRATATVTFRSVGYTWSPAEGTYWLVQAYTSSPDALSTTPPLLWKPGP